MNSNPLPGYDAWKLASPYDMTDEEELDAIARELGKLAASDCWACGGYGYIDQRDNPCDCTRQVTVDQLCDDCPPVGYPTDRTRCDGCPRTSVTEDPFTVSTP